MIVALIFVGVHWYKSRPLASGAAPPLAGALTGDALLAERFGTLFGIADDGAGGAGGAPRFDLAALRGEPVLVYFWATWCPICKLSEGAIDDLAADYRVITVAMQSGSAAEVGGYLHARGLSFATIADPYGERAAEWGVPAVPAAFVVDRDGQIVYGGVGYAAGVGLRARLWAARVLD